jgi:sensor histidine kinase YesM
LPHLRTRVAVGSGFDASFGGSGSGSGSAWVGLLVFGIMLIASSIFGYAISASQYDTPETSFFYETDREAGRMFAIFATITLILGFILIAISFKVRRDEQMRLVTMARIAQENRDQQISQIAKAVKSTIKVRCRYCGTLNEEDASNCDSCGATL